MELESFHRLVLAGVLGATSGMLAWLVAKLGLILWSAVTARRREILPMLAAPGDSKRREHRRLGREIGAWLASLLAAAAVFTVVYLFAPARIAFEVADWSWIAAAAMVIADLGFVLYMIYRIARARRRFGHAWAMRRSVGAVLERLSISGYRIFHEVRVEDELIDHVVLGEKGVFLVTTVARRPDRKDPERMVKLKAGKLGFSNGVIEGMPVGNAARKLSMLSSELNRIVGHKVAVKSIIAVPGWRSQPEADANHLLLNEDNLVTMTSWTSAETFLMREDLPGLEKFLGDASSVATL